MVFLTLYFVLSYCMAKGRELLMLTITEGRLAEELTFEGIVMVNADFRYPIVSSGSSKADKRINSYYKHIAKALLRKAGNELLPSAVDEWRYSVENSYPFRQFETVMKYTVTCNEDDILSLYYDVYEYTGGAHGMTKRFGDTCVPRQAGLSSLPTFSRAAQTISDF